MHAIARGPIRVDVSGRSDRGRLRCSNQDAYLVGALVPGAEGEWLAEARAYAAAPPASRIPHARALPWLLAVADGMGGYAGGAHASATALAALAEATLPRPGPLGLGFLGRRGWAGSASPAVHAWLAAALERCQEQVCRIAARTSPGMGTTLTAALVDWPRVHVAHVGDSRCYLLRGGRLMQLTTDHTIGRQLVDAGWLDGAALARSPWRKVLWNAIGGGQRLFAPDIDEVVLSPGDALLLCSDGLTRQVSDRGIARALDASRDADEACARLIDAANAAGGADNVTAIVARFERVAAPARLDALAEQAVG